MTHTSVQHILRSGVFSILAPKKLGIFSLKPINLKKCGRQWVPKVGGPLHMMAMAILFTAQCTLVQMRGLGIACRPSVCDVGGL